MNRMLILALLPVAVGASASCVTDPPEIGDIGPDSEIVCRELARRFPGAGLEVVGRSIHSPTDVSVMASVDGRPVMLDYRLAGLAWGVAKTGSPSADKASPQADRPTGTVAAAAR